jgi:hypothetical protein
MADYMVRHLSVQSSKKLKRLRPALSSRLWLAPAALLPLAINGTNVVLVLYSIFVLGVGIKLLWRPGEPPILLFVFLYQWMQSATGALYANAMGITLAQVTDPDQMVIRGAHEFASGLMLTGVLVLAFAMKLAAGKPSLDFGARLKAFVTSRPFSFWFRVHAATWVIGTICAIIAPMAEGLRLPLLTLSGIKWGGFFLLTFSAFSGSSPSARTIWGLIFGFEFLLSIGGYFASFKDVFVFAIFGLAAANVRLTPRILISGTALAAIMLALGIVWTAVKVDYRAFVNAGSGQQVVVTGYGESLAQIRRSVSNLDGEDLSEATDRLIKRVSYHHYFGAVTNRVPSTLRHTGGEIWGEAIIRPLMPRLLFPDKRAINDSDLTNQYTGLRVATAEQGASISIGYMAEAYIDFGPIFMFGAIGTLGAGIGFFYRWLLHKRGTMVVAGAALAPFALMPAHLAETSILKMIPSLFLTFLACIVVLKLLAPMVLRRQLRPAARLVRP